MLKNLSRMRVGLKTDHEYAGMTPLWDAFYIKEQNRKFKNKWEKIKRINKKR